MTTLEEVFLKVNGDLEDEMKPSKEDRDSTLQGISDEDNALIKDETENFNAEETKAAN